MTPCAAILQISQFLNTAVIGQEAAVECILIALLANGHVRMEGLPGVVAPSAYASVRCLR